MSGRDPFDPTLADKSVLVVGAGGLGCPAALVLVEAGVGRLALADDDIVDVTNLHRQLLYRDDDIGRDKLDAALDALRARARPHQRIEAVRTRLLPENAQSLVRDFDVVIEGADNYATKFLASDACLLEGRPVVHGAAVRFRSTAFSVSPRGAPCYRCLFEDLPPADAALTCAEAGVTGPLVGVTGALLADLALGVLLGEPRYGIFTTFDGLGDRLRTISIGARAGCTLCGRTPRISRIDELCYRQPAGLTG
jgi:molybdopterin/thiamine biosynthesis adenylyltransferase